MARNVPKIVRRDRAFPLDMQVKWRPVGGTVFTDEPHRMVLRSADQVTYGANYPDWRLRLSLGVDTTTTLAGTRVFCKQQQPLDFQVLGNSWNYKGFARVGFGDSLSFSLPGDPGGVIDSIAERQAASRFLKSYINATRTWHGGATIAEFAETVRFLASPIKSLYRHTFEFVGRVGRLRKVYRQDPVKYGKLLSTLWLSYAFGISPLVSDVNDAYAAVKAMADNLSSSSHKRIIGSGENIVAIDHDPAYPIPFTGYAFQSVTRTQANRVRYLGSLRCHPPGPAAIFQNFGVGFTDILPSVWEGIPWSWLVDYFVNVNEMLDSVKLATADFSWMSRTVRNSRVHRYGSARIIISPFDRHLMGGYATGGQGLTMRTVVSRTPTSVPYPSWRFRIPGLPSQYANISALVNAIDRSKPPTPLGPVRRR